MSWQCEGGGPKKGYIDVHNFNPSGDMKQKSRTDS